MISCSSRLKAILLAVRALASTRSDSSLVIHTDNTTVMQCINNFGSLHYPVLNDPERELWAWSFERNLFYAPRTARELKTPFRMRCPELHGITIATLTTRQSSTRSTTLRGLSRWTSSHIPRIARCLPTSAGPATRSLTACPLPQRIRKVKM